MRAMSVTTTAASPSKLPGREADPVAGRRKGRSVSHLRRAFILELARSRGCPIAIISAIRAGGLVNSLGAASSFSALDFVMSFRYLAWLCRL